MLETTGMESVPCFHSSRRPLAGDTEQWRLCGGTQVWTVQMRLKGQTDRYTPVHEPTDGWMAERPTTGQRALQLNKGKWVLVPPASRRTTTILKSLVRPYYSAVTGSMLAALQSHGVSNLATHLPIAAIAVCESLCQRQCRTWVKLLICRPVGWTRRSRRRRAFRCCPCASMARRASPSRTASSRASSASRCARCAAS